MIFYHTSTKSKGKDWEPMGNNARYLMLAWINFHLRERERLAVPSVSECTQKVWLLLFVVHQRLLPDIKVDFSYYTRPTRKTTPCMHLYILIPFRCILRAERRIPVGANPMQRLIYHKSSHLPSNVRPRKKVEDPKADVKWLFPSELMQSRQWQ